MLKDTLEHTSNALITQLIDAKTNPASNTALPAPKKRLGIRSLNDANDVRRLLARLIKARLADDSALDNETLRAITQACSVILKASELADLDDRLTEIEKQLSGQERKL